MTVLENSIGSTPWSVCGNLDSIQSSVSQLPSRVGRILPYLLWWGTCRWTRYDFHGVSWIKEGFYYNSTTQYLISAFINWSQDIWLTVVPYHVLILNHKVIALSPEASSIQIFGFPVVCLDFLWLLRRYNLHLCFSGWFFASMSSGVIIITFQIYKQHLLLSHSNCASFRTMWCTQTVSNYFSYDCKLATKDLNLSKNSQLKESEVVVFYPIIDPIKGSVVSNWKCVCQDDDLLVSIYS